MRMQMCYVPKILSLCVIALQAEPPRTIPEQLYDAFTMGRTVPVISWYFNEAYPDTKPITYTKQALDQYIEKTWQRKTSYYRRTDTWLYQALDKFAAQYVAGKEVAVLGSVNPCYEGIVLAYKGVPTTIDYNKIISTDLRLKAMTVTEYQENPIKFDALVSISSFEHDGLGRYGDPINPDGDLRAMRECKDMLKPGGLLFLAVPVGPDTLVWNAHRIYGRKRLPKLLEGWRVLASFGFSERLFKGRLAKMHGHQPVFVLTQE